jgi:hypothetical protein
MRDSITPDGGVWDIIVPDAAVWDIIVPGSGVWDIITPDGGVWDIILPGGGVWDIIVPDVWLMDVSLYRTSECGTTGGLAIEAAGHGGAQVIPSFLDFLIGRKGSSNLAVITNWDRMTAYINNVVLPIVNAWAPVPGHFDSFPTLYFPDAMLNEWASVPAPFDSFPTLYFPNGLLNT